MVPYRVGAVGAQLKSAVLFGLGSRTLSRGVVGQLETRIEDSAPADAGDVCQRFIRLFGGTTIYRDQTYLDWRVFRNPYTKPIMRTISENSKTIGWVIYSIGDEKIGYIVDVMAAPSESAAYSAQDLVKRLLWEATIDLKRTGVLAVRGWSVTPHKFDQLVRRAAVSLGYYHVRKGHAVVLMSPDEDCQATLATDYPNWYITRIFTEGVAG